jgi:membrane-bound metal-dependent hydrolase YbcI (DUF457 family)
LPYTPYHFGPGLLLKSVAPRHVSVIGYAAANVAIDVESLYHVLRREWPIHRWAHTFLGAGAIGVVTGIVLVVAFRRLASHPRLQAPALREDLARGPVLIGAFLGAITHPLLDGLMHRDQRPFLPFSAANPLLGAVSIGALIWFCVATGVLGGGILLLRRTK